MEVALIMKIAGIGLIVAVAHQILTRTGREEQATLLSVAGVIVVLVLIVSQLGGLFDDLRSVFGI